MRSGVHSHETSNKPPARADAEDFLHRVHTHVRRRHVAEAQVQRLAELDLVRAARRLAGGRSSSGQSSEKGRMDSAVGRGYAAPLLAK